MSEIYGDAELITVRVTCETEGCGNAGHALDISVYSGSIPYVVCGVCGLQITDVVEVAS